ncbi:MAG TPA: hypothetical protein VNK41_10745 [Vicinamibacterales bacterium]|nr:hypothetical protein [Vicinamibacterales bacterium]
MGVNWAGLWKVAQAVFGIAEASRQFMGPRTSSDAQRGVLGVTDLARTPASGGMLGQFEARLTGVVVSALKEAFDRDAARLDLERSMLEDQRHRAEQALRLELVRQAGDRALARLRAIGVMALVVWIVSVLFVMRFPDGLDGAARIVLGAGWLALFGAGAASFVAYSRVSRWLATAHLGNAAPESLPEDGPAALAPWLGLGGFALVAVSLLLAL